MAEAAVLGQHQEFLAALETTRMTKSYKMLLLRAWVDEGVFPRPIPIQQLVEAIQTQITRSAQLQDDVGDASGSPASLQRLLEINPIAAWTEGKDTPGGPYFRYTDQVMRTDLATDGHSDDALRAFVQELVDWRLSQYLARGGAGRRAARFVCTVSHSGGGQPILFLPDRAKTPGLPLGPTPIRAKEEVLEAKFVKVALNVVRRPPDTTNVLPELLRGWFGPTAGASGQALQQVVFEDQGEVYLMHPVVDGGPELWAEVSRPDIPGLWGVPYRETRWRQGYLVEGGHMFLLVTLEKRGMQEEHRYDDRFESPDRFVWQSQNRTSQASKAGQDISQHEERGIPVHLFVRRTGKSPRGKASPFAYCGELDFVSWQGEKPITVTWALRTPVPERLWGSLVVPAPEAE